MKQYIPAQLDLLYEAIQEQAERDFMAALAREYSNISEQEKQIVHEYYRVLRAKAEARMVAEQGE